MRIRDSAAFVIGANRGLGLAFAQELLAAPIIRDFLARKLPKQVRAA
jgi:NAD(P)-dependent dehydrogenase (short-subunit alcohol dehydrogenase family)